jgi:hypothetical protein
VTCDEHFIIRGMKRPAHHRIYSDLNNRAKEVKIGDLVSREEPFPPPTLVTGGLLLVNCKVNADQSPLLYTDVVMMNLKFVKT